jgi:hypothetical protein
MNHEHAGPGTEPRRWTGLCEFEICRPRLRARKNPVPQTFGGAQQFPFAGVGFVNNQQVFLQLLAWELRDSFLVLQAQTWNTPANLFTNGQNGTLFSFGSTGNNGPNKPYLLANINSNNGLLPSPQSFLSTHITQIIRGDVYQADLLNLAYSTYLQFKAGDQLWIYAEGYGAEYPNSETQIQSQAVGSYAASLAGLGWPTGHVNKSLRSGLIDPSTNTEDPGYNIAQNKNMQFIYDPTQFSFNASTIASGGWPTIATASHGTGMQISICLRGALARGMSG